MEFSDEDEWIPTWICAKAHTWLARATPEGPELCDRPKCPICGGPVLDLFDEVWPFMKHQVQAEKATEHEIEPVRVRARISRMVARASKRINAVGDGPIGQLHLRCENGHPWVAIPNLELKWGCEPAQCPRCGLIFSTKRIVLGEYGDGRPCSANCRRATDDVCLCECGGANHGTELGAPESND